MLSCVVLTKNAEETIEKCLRSLMFCDEILIIDDHSTDKTGLKIKNLHSEKIHVYERKLANNFSAQRNFGLEKTNGDWILFIDADEIVSDALAFEILGKINQPQKAVQGYFFLRRDVLWGKQLMHGESGSMKLLRLARKQAGVWKGSVHEIWQVKGRKETLKNPLAHYPHQTIKEFLSEINYYSTLRAQELLAKKTNVSILSIIFYPTVKFFMNYFIKLGVLDGIPGLISAVMMSLHSFLVRGKLWLFLQEKNEKK